MISSKQLAEAIYKLSKEGISADKITEFLFPYLRKYNMTSILPKIIQRLDNFEKKERLFNTLEIKSGLPIDSDITKEIGQILGAEENSPVEKKTDPELLGGFTATYKGFLYDASLRNQLNLLKAKLTEY